MLAPEVVESAERRVGQTLCGKWRLDRVIGIGGMAAVYEATHRNRNRVAIKLLHPALSLEEGTRRRFLREGYVANTIRHPGAVQVLDDDVTEDGVAFLVMELLSGESVEERMSRRGGALDIFEALDIASQTLEILGAAHDQKVVHRDIKPDNIFITDSGEIKVLDFGIARLNQGDEGFTQVGSFMGTPAFCAQEQARGRWNDVDHRTDLFSVGATLFTCLTGEHVHEGETSSEQLALAVSSPARSLAQAFPGCPAELVELVDKALAYEKENRHQSARAMKAAVTRVAAGLPFASGVVKAPSKRTRISQATTNIGGSGFDPESVIPPGWARGERLLLWGGGLLLAALLGALFFIAFRKNDSEMPGAIGKPPRPFKGLDENSPSPPPSREKGDDPSSKVPSPPPSEQQEVENRSAEAWKVPPSSSAEFQNASPDGTATPVSSGTPNSGTDLPRREPAPRPVGPPSPVQPDEDPFRSRF